MSRMQCVEKNMKLFPLAVCQKLKISSNCHSVNFPTFKTVSVSKKEMLVAKCQIAKVSMGLIYNVHWQFLEAMLCQKKRNRAKTGKESKDEKEDRRKKEEQSKNHFYFSVDCPNIHVLSLLWSCLATEINSILGKTAVRNLDSQDLKLPHQHAELLCGERVQVAWQQDLQM